MAAFISWYLVITLAGWLAFPLAYRFLPGLPDRGYALTRALGWLVWGYLFWLLASLGVIQNDLGGVLLALILLGVLSAWAAWGGRYREIIAWLRERGRLIASVELVFLVAFAVWAFVRAANPEIDNTEKPMELAFLNAILRSPVFPPHDPWLSGYAISYYYFGYVLVAMLVRITGVAVGAGFNLAIALLFGLTAVGAYGLVYDLLALRKGSKAGGFLKPSLRLPLLGPLFILLVSNLEGFLEVLHARGLFRGGNFWSWLGILDINQPPVAPVSWMPERTWAWWRASRVLGDFSFDGLPREVIDEFPFFSYLLADLHPHVLAMPFALLMVGLALNVFLERGREKFSIFGWTIPFSPQAFLFAAVLLGGLAFLNTWDFPIYIALVCAAYVLARVQEAGWDWPRLGEFASLGAGLGISGILLYLPFYLGFSSQAGGILPSMVFFTRGTQFWVMFAPLLVPILALLLWMVIRQERARAALVKGSLISLAAILVLWVGMYLFGYAITLLPTLGNLYMGDVVRAAGQGIGDVIRASLVGHTAPEAGWLAGRLTAPGAWISLAVILTLVVALLAAFGRRDQPESPPGQPEAARDVEPEVVSNGPRIEGFWLLLALLGILLVLFPEFFYLRDQFGVRMNTIFKFYYQAWLVWGIAAAFAIAVFLEDLRGAWGWVYRAGLVVLLVMGLAYPTWSLWMKTGGFQPDGGLTLDGNAFLTRVAPDAMAAAEWLREAPPGVIAEAPGRAVPVRYLPAGYPIRRPDGDRVGRARIAVARRRPPVRVAPARPGKAVPDGGLERSIKHHPGIFDPLYRGGADRAQQIPRQRGKIPAQPGPGLHNRAR